MDKVIKQMETDQPALLPAQATPVDLRLDTFRDSVMQQNSSSRLSFTTLRRNHGNQDPQHVWEIGFTTMGNFMQTNMEVIQF